MAEIFGIVTGALSIAALFNNAVDCFEYIQLGRNFGTDYQTCQIRLDIAQLRLSRWGAAVDAQSNPDFTEVHPRSNDAQTAKRTLEQLLKLLHHAYTQSYDFKSGAKEEELAVFDPSSNTNQAVKSLRTKLRTLTTGRKKSTDLSKKISWALYKQKFFTRLIDDIQELLDGLEKIYPVKESYKQLAEEEIGELEDEVSLRIVSEASQDTDNILRAAAEEKLERLEASNSIGKAKVTGAAKVKVGDEYISQPIPGGISSGTTSNRIADLDASGESRVHVGTSYIQGGKGFLD